MTHDELVRAIQLQSQDIRRLTFWMRFLSGLVALMVLLIAANAFGSDLDVIRADRAKFPQSRWGQLFYAILTNVPPENRLQLQRAFDFTVASCSTQQILERSLPVPLSPTVLRLDTRQLRWSELPSILKEHYPYYGGSRVPGAFRADWFVDFVLDQTKSDAYLRLLNGKKPPENAEDLNKLFGAEESRLVNNWVEDTSGVAVNRTRLIKSFPTKLRTDLWRTFDWSELNFKTDPLQHLGRKLDGSVSEWIGPLVKVSIATGQQGHLQQYYLTNQQGDIASDAPINIVVDHTAIGPQLISPRSCISCHSEGLRPLSTNSVRRFVNAALNDERLAVIAPKGSDERERIERQFMAQLESNIKYHNDRYAAIVKLITGRTPEETSEDVVQVILDYNEDVTFADGCRELRMTEQSFLAQLARTGNIPARLAQFPKVPMSRENWESIYVEALKVARRGRPRIIRR